jgi:hypothetical protein
MSVILAISFFVIVLDNVLGFSFHYRMSNKIDELTKVNLIIQNPLSDSIIRSNAVVLRQEIITRRNIFDYLFFRNSSTILNNAQTNSPAQSPSPKESIKNVYVYLMSTGGFIVLFGLMMCTTDFFYSDESNMLLRLITGISYFISPFSIAVLLSFILNLVPTFGRNGSGNVVLNFSIQMLVLAGILQFFIRYYRSRIKKMTKRKEELEAEYSTVGHA